MEINSRLELKQTKVASNDPGLAHFSYAFIAPKEKKGVTKKSRSSKFSAKPTIRQDRYEMIRLALYITSY